MTSAVTPGDDDQPLERRRVPRSSGENVKENRQPGRGQARTPLDPLRPAQAHVFDEQPVGVQPDVFGFNCSTSVAAAIATGAAAGSKGVATAGGALAESPPRWQR